MTVLLESFEDRDRTRFFYTEKSLVQLAGEKRRLPTISYSRQDNNDFSRIHPLAERFVLPDDTETKSSDGSRSRSSDCSDFSVPDDEFTNVSISSTDANDLLINFKEVVIPSTSAGASSGICSCLDKNETSPIDNKQSYMTLRVTYLVVTLVVMLADGLQGTHLYVLYEGYGFSVATLYCIGFLMGGFMSPITGPLVDKIGRKKAAVLYCCLEILINLMEQYPFLYGLILSRMMGGFTTNLLSSVFETWLDTEYRRRGFEKEKYEIIMRDSVIVSNLAAIFSGYLAHTLAERYGAVGPFEGAVTCTAIALVVVCFVWTENYGSSGDDSKCMIAYFKEAVEAFRADGRMRRIGVLQGLSAGCVQIFVFLWAPTMRQLSRNAPAGCWGLDKYGEPAYGLIFGAFMGAGVFGGLIAPAVRKVVTNVLTPKSNEAATMQTIEIDIDSEGSVSVRPMAVEFLASTCYFLSALLLFVPYLVSDENEYGFSLSLYALLVFELLIGIFLPCEGVIRSIYFPTSARASIMTLPRIIVNVAVAMGVLSTNYIEMKTAFFVVGCIMLTSGCLQLSLVSTRDWDSVFSHLDYFANQLSLTMCHMFRNMARIKECFLFLPLPFFSKRFENSSATKMNIFQMNEKKIKVQ